LGTAGRPPSFRSLPPPLRHPPGNGSEVFSLLRQPQQKSGKLTKSPGPVSKTGKDRDTGRKPRGCPFQAPEMGLRGPILGPGRKAQPGRIGAFFIIDAVATAHPYRCQYPNRDLLFNPRRHRDAGPVFFRHPLRHPDGLMVVFVMWWRMEADYSASNSPLHVTLCGARMEQAGRPGNRPGLVLQRPARAAVLEGPRGVLDLLHDRAHGARDGLLRGLRRYRDGLPPAGPALAPVRPGVLAVLAWSLPEGSGAYVPLALLSIIPLAAGTAGLALRPEGREAATRVVNANLSSIILFVLLADIWLLLTPAPA